ncbi:HNH endonuclease [Alkalithermobacter paradoxus]
MIKKEKILKDIKNRITFLIKHLSKKKLEEKLGFEEIDFSDLYFPKYTFQYISPGGNSSMSVDVKFDLENLEKFIEYLSEKIKWQNSVEGQRALMTPKLREFIKERDNYTCRICHNSTEKEPNLLLEIDHIVPISRGGKTEVENLQTLRWKCNRRKGAKLVV